MLLFSGVQEALFCSTIRTRHQAWPKRTCHQKFVFEIGLTYPWPVFKWNWQLTLTFWKKFMRSKKNVPAFSLNSSKDPSFAASQIFLYTVCCRVLEKNSRQDDKQTLLLLDWFAVQERVLGAWWSGWALCKSVFCWGRFLLQQEIWAGCFATCTSPGSRRPLELPYLRTTYFALECVAKSTQSQNTSTTK